MMGLSDAARTAADITKCLFHVPPPRTNNKAVADGLRILLATLVNNAKHINGGWLKLVVDSCGLYKFEFHNDKCAKKDRIIGIICPKILFEDAKSYMERSGVCTGFNQPKQLVIVNVYKLAQLETVSQ